VTPKFKCSHCAKCCLTVPCVFAQVKHKLRKSERHCPDLEKKDDGTYHCKMIERDPEAAAVLLSGDCDDPARPHLKKKFNPDNIILEFFPNASEEEIDFILWEKTSFPEFWNIPQDGWTAEQCLRTELKRLKEVSL
jgi:hypothetical protein